MAEEQQLFKVTIDNITVEVPAGTTILNAARKIGGKWLRLQCAITVKLQGSGGKCRTCLVEVAQVLRKIRGQCQNWWQHAEQK